MTGVWVGVCCPRCEAEMVHVVSSKPTDSGRRSTAVFKCPTRFCPDQQLVAELVTCGAPPPDPAPLKESA